MIPQKAYAKTDERVEPAMTRKSYSKPDIVSRKVALGVYGDYRPSERHSERRAPDSPTKTNPILPDQI